MTSSRPEVVPTPVAPMSNAAFAHQARTMVIHHGDRILSEVPKVIRRVGLFLMVATIAIPAFLVGLLVVLWHLAH
jgi:hypothetical protein